MSQNDINVKYKLNEDGSIKKTASDVKKLGKETETVSNSQEKLNKKKNQYSKREKGAAGITSNSTKAFAKQAQTIDGSGGLVPAYATLAANIFAVTAAFGVLQRAAQVEQLSQGLTELGKSSGLAMRTLASGLVEATGAALSFEESMRSTIAITSAGLDPSKVEALGKAAKNASTALGRDMQDSIQRLTRGITKLEPELLDELGIFVRLDVATAEYALSVNKTAGELTNFEKRQAFANAVLAEADQKFGAIGNNVDSNPYNRLLATFSNLAKEGLDLVNLVLKPIVGYLADSPTALVGVIGVFASSVVSQIVPSLKASADTARETAKAYADSSKRAAKVISESYKKAEKDTLEGFKKIEKANQTLKQGGIAKKTVTSFVKEYENANDKAKFLNKTLKDLKSSEALRLKSAQLNTDEKQRELKEVQSLITLTKKLQKEESTRVSLSGAGQRAKGKATSSNLTSRGLSQMENTTDDLSGLMDSFGIATKYSALQVKNLGKQEGFINKLSLSFKALSGSAQLFGSVILRAIPILGQIIFAFSMIKEGLSFIIDLFKTDASRKFEEDVLAVSEATKELAGNLAEVDKAIAGQSNKILTTSQTYISLYNILDQFDSKYKELNSAVLNQSDVLEAQETAIFNLIGSSKLLTAEFNKETKAKLAAAKSDVKRVSILETFINKHKVAAGTVKSLKESIESGKKATTEYMNALKPTTSITALSESFDAIARAVEDAAQSAESGTQVILENLSKQQAALLGVFEQQKQAEKIQKDIAEKEKQRKAAQEKYGEAKGNFFGFGRDDEAAKAALQEVRDIEREISKLRKDGIEIVKDSGDIVAENVTSVSAELAAAKLTLSVNKNKVALADSELKLQKAIGGLSTKSLEKTIKLTNAKNASSKTGIEAQLAADEIILKSLETQKKFGAEYINLQNKIKKAKADIQTLDENSIDALEKTSMLAKQSLTILQFTQKADQALLSQIEKRNKLEAENLSLKERAAKRSVEAYEISLKQKNAADPFKTSRDLDPNQEYLLTKKRVGEESDLYKQRDALKKAELNADKTRITLQYDLIDAQYTLLAAQVAVEKSKAKKAGDTALVTSLENASTALSKAQENSATNRKTAISTVEDRIAEIDKVTGHEKAKNAEVIADAADKAIEFGKTAGGSLGDRIRAASGEGGLFNLDEATTRDKVQAIGNMLQPLGDELRALGPEGELVASVQEGMFAIIDSVQLFGEISDSVLKSFNERTKSTFTSIGDAWDGMSFEEKAQVVAGALNIVGQSLGALAGAMRAASQNAIDGIDKQIEREKALDGKSAESVKKLQQLEAKKEQMKRKAFEQDKKMKLAQAVIGTATGVAQALSSAPPPYNIVLAGLVGAMGAAQVSLISGMTYNGGGASDVGSAASSASIGSRAASTDLASSRGGAGELSYFRGAQGTGGPENFTPAFTGTKYRASGGETTGFMVGEQGPELFVPEKPGRIVPADEIAQGTPINANINISAIDAEGVEDVLVRQRGNIIGMIREAANANGETFLESVSTSEV